MTTHPNDTYDHDPTDGNGRAHPFLVDYAYPERENSAYWRIYAVAMERYVDALTTYTDRLEMELRRWQLAMALGWLVAAALLVTLAGGGG